MPFRALWIEDEPAFQKAALRILRKNYPTCDITFVGNGDEALPLARDQAFDLIFMDHNHPGARGTELARRLRLSVAHRRTPIVMISGNLESAAVQFVLQESVDVFLPKPVDTNELVRAVESLYRTNWEARAIAFGAERPDLDYKSGTLDLETGDALASIAKDVIAFANFGGGCIVVGRHETSPGNFDEAGAPWAI